MFLGGVYITHVIWHSIVAKENRELKFRGKEVMGLVGAIILFIILAINAASKGDYSGLEMIGKFVLFIVLFIVIGTILTMPALLIIAIAIFLIVLACASAK